MTAIAAGLFYVVATVAGLNSQSLDWDAPIPTRCRTVEVRFLPENRPFCEAWEAKHWVGPKRTPGR